LGVFAILKLTKCTTPQEQIQFGEAEMIFLVARLAGASATYKLNSIPGITGPPEHGLYLKFKKSIRLELYKMQSQNIHVVKPVSGGQ
jgi:hypothetical protein